MFMTNASGMHGGGETSFKKSEKKKLKGEWHKENKIPVGGILCRAIKKP